MDLQDVIGKRVCVDYLVSCNNVMSLLCTLGTFSRKPEMDLANFKKETTSMIHENEQLQIRKSAVQKEI